MIRFGDIDLTLKVTGALGDIDLTLKVTGALERQLLTRNKLVCTLSLETMDGITPNLMDCIIGMDTRLDLYILMT